MTVQQSVSSWSFLALATLLGAVVVAAVLKRVAFIRRVNKVPGMAGGLTLMGNTSYVSIQRSLLYTFIIN